VWWHGHVLWIPLPVSLVLNIAYIGVLSWWYKKSRIENLQYGFNDF
jgi:hypothetical protein